MRVAVSHEHHASVQPWDLQQVTRANHRVLQPAVPHRLLAEELPRDRHGEDRVERDGDEVRGVVSDGHAGDTDEAAHRAGARGEGGEARDAAVVDRGWVRPIVRLWGSDAEDVGDFAQSLRAEARDDLGAPRDRRRECGVAFGTAFGDVAARELHGSGWARVEKRRRGAG